MSHVSTVVSGATGLGHSVALRLPACGVQVVAAEKNAPSRRTDLDVFIEDGTPRIPTDRRSSCDEIASNAASLALEAPDYIGAGRLNLSGCLDKD